MNIYRNQSSPLLHPSTAGLVLADVGQRPSSPSCPGEYPVPYSASQWLVEPSWYKSRRFPALVLPWGRRGSPRMKLR